MAAGVSSKANGGRNGHGRDRAALGTLISLRARRAATFGALSLSAMGPPGGVPLAALHPRRAWLGQNGPTAVAPTQRQKTPDRPSQEPTPACLPTQSLPAIFRQPPAE